MENIFKWYLYSLIYGKYLKIILVFLSKINIGLKTFWSERYGLEVSKFSQVWRLILSKKLAQKVWKEAESFFLKHLHDLTAERLQL
jgi:hypothetical protein